MSIQHKSGAWDMEFGDLLNVILFTQIFVLKSDRDISGARFFIESNEQGRNSLYFLVKSCKYSRRLRELAKNVHFR